MALTAVGFAIFTTQAAPPPAGTLINNQAAGEYVSHLGSTEQIQSETVHVIVSATAPLISIGKTASTGTAARNENVAFTVTAGNAGSAAAAGINVNIDGVAATAVLVRDVIPRNTIFSNVVSAGTSQVLYHYHGEATHNYHTALPSSLDAVDAVAFGYPSLAVAQSVSIGFSVTVEPSAAGTFTNVAAIHFHDGTNAVAEVSNPVAVSIPSAPPTISYYTSDAYRQQAHVFHLGNTLFVQAVAGFCNADPTAVEHRAIAIKSRLTKDYELFDGVETGPNSGIFRITPSPATRNAAQFPTVRTNGIIETVANDTLTAIIVGCDNNSTEAQALIRVDPFGVVFDSSNDQPVAGAIVTLIDVTGAGNGGHPNQPATVLAVDGVTPAPPTITTVADGAFQFPEVLPSVYRLQITAPKGFKFPSTVPATSLAVTRNIDTSGSYGGNFTVNVLTGTVQLDVPLDPASVGTAMLIEKTASRSLVEIGDTLRYEIKIRNTTTSPLTGVRVSDSLPAGFKYLKGSAQLNNVAIGNPVGGAGPQLEFQIGTLAGSATVSLTYRVRVGPGSLQGDGVNSAQAASIKPRGFSNVATSRVKIDPGVFDDKAILIGKVFIDDNENGVQDAGELGIPGVRLYMENGDFVITDSEGKFSIYGLSPRTHVLKVDNTTLPPGAKLLAFSIKHAGDGGSRFVDMKKYELHKANFAVVRSDKVVENVLARRKKGEVEVAEIEKGVKDTLPTEGQLQQIENADYRAMPATGILGDKTKAAQPAESTGRTTTAGQTPNASAPKTSILPGTNAAPNFTSLLPSNTLNSANSNLPRRPNSPLPYVNLESLVTNLTDNSPGFINLKDKDTLPVAQTDIRIKGVMGSQFVLSVNGDEVPAKRIGKRSVFPPKQVEAWEYIAVTLKPGENKLELVQKDPFGNPRGQVAITVQAPDKLGKIKIILPNKELEADGVTPAKVRVEVTDDKGVPVTARTPLTLEVAGGARWDVKDLDKAEPGVQVFIEGGRAEYKLLPPTEPENSRIRVSSGILEEEIEVPFLPDLRPLVAAGVIEGAINLSSIHAGALVPTRSRDGFEEELRGFAATSSDGKTHGGGRVAFFLKGKIKGDYLLTAGYDSDKDTHERLFRDIQPDRFYPVYGDSSVKGYDAQSTGRLYVRIDKKKCYLLYGDFVTQSQSEARLLGNYNRSLTGVREHYEKNRVSANVWASEDSTRQVVEEIRANGTSGPYDFKTAGAIINSEKVQIITRDRNQPSIVLKVVEMARFTDYEFEPFTGQILFKAPVPSLDENLNPIFIRVTYETETNGKRFWVYGADAQMKVTDRWEVGGSAVRDEDPADNYQLLSGNTTLKLGKQTYLMGEVARSESDLNGTGDAGRVELRSKTDKTDLRAYFGKTEQSFTNSTSMMQPGRIEGGFKLAQRLTATTRFLTEGIYTEDTQQSGTRKGVLASVEKSFGDYRLELGGRYSTETTMAASTNMVGLTPNDVYSLRARFTAPVPHVKGASVYTEYENDVSEIDKRMVALGGEYQLKNKGRLYARHEFINAIGGPYELNTSQQQNSTVFGGDFEYMKDGRYFNEYRARDSFAGRDAEAAVGLRNGWHVAEGVTLSTTLERVTPIQGGKENESTAVTGGIEYTRPEDWKATGRLELRSSTATDSLLNSLGYARKLNRDWTFLSRTLLYVTDEKGNGVDRTQGRFQAGMAYRQTETDRWNALGKYEFRYEEGAAPSSVLMENRQIHILSFDLNYQPSEDWTLSGHYAGKLAIENDPIASTYHAHLLGARVCYEITKRWDVGLNANALWSEQFSSIQYGIGPEVGFTIHNNLRIGLGYNFMGFHDRDLSSGNYTEHGVYIHLRLKFDEGLLGLGSRKANGKDRQ